MSLAAGSWCFTVGPRQSGLSCVKDSGYMPGYMPGAPYPFHILLSGVQWNNRQSAGPKEALSPRMSSASMLACPGLCLQQLFESRTPRIAVNGGLFLNDGVPVSMSRYIIYAPTVNRWQDERRFNHLLGHNPEQSTRLSSTMMGCIDMPSSCNEAGAPSEEPWLNTLPCSEIVSTFMDPKVAWLFNKKPVWSSGMILRSG